MASEVLKIDSNDKPVIGLVTDNAAQEIRMGRIDDVTKGLKVMIVGGAGSGTVTSVSVVNANGFNGSVATNTTTPAITLSTTITGLLQGNGTAISAVTIGSGLSFVAGTLSATGGGITVGTTTITGGTNTRILYDNSGVVGEYTLTGSGTVVAMQTSPSLITPALGVATATSLAIGGATIGANGLAVTGHILLEGVTSTGATGTGKFVFDGSPTLVTPVLGVATVTSINKVAFTAPTTAATIVFGTDNATITFQGTDTYVGRATTDTLTNKRITRRFVTTTQSSTPTINTDNTDIASITALAQAITSMTTNLTGTPVAGDYLQIQITDNGTARAITWGASFASTTVTLPTTTVISTLLRVGFQWDTVAAKWQCIAVA